MHTGVLYNGTAELQTAEGRVGRAFAELSVLQFFRVQYFSTVRRTGVLHTVQSALSYGYCSTVEIACKAESCTGYEACAHGYPRLPVGRLGPPMTHPRFARSRLDHPYPPTPASRPYPYPPSTHFPCKNLARRRLFF
jgi:hypothetical protein